MERICPASRASLGRKIVIFSLITASAFFFITGCSENSVDNNRPASSSFGVSNSYDGQLTGRFEDRVPQPMQNAFWIEPVRDVTTSELNEITKKKQFVAEEVNNGQLYVATRDLRVVQIDTFSTGLLVYIERYRVVDSY